MRAARIGQLANLAVHDPNQVRHLAPELLALVLRVHGDLERPHHGRLAHSARQLRLAPVGGRVPKPLGRRELARDNRVRQVVIVERVRLVGLVDLEPVKDPLHMIDEVVSEVLPAGPLVEPEGTLLIDRRSCRTVQQIIAFLRIELTAVVSSELILVLVELPPGPNHRGPQRHRPLLPVSQS